jgi:hypothetical protein
MSGIGWQISVAVQLTGFAGLQVLGISGWPGSQLGWPSVAMSR